MPWDQNFRYNLHCKHTFWHLKLKTKYFYNIHALFKQLRTYTLQCGSVIKCASIRVCLSF